MPAKYIPSEEELKQILQYYAECKTYSEVSRRTGLSLPVVKRIIDENKTEIPKAAALVKHLVYNGLVPLETKEKQIKEFNKELEEFYKEVIKNGGILQD